MTIHFKIEDELKKCNNSEMEGSSKKQSFVFARKPWNMLKTYEKKL